MSNGSIYGNQVPTIDPILSAQAARVASEQIYVAATDEYMAACQKAADVLQADMADAQRRQVEAVEHAGRIYRLRLGVD